MKAGMLLRDTGRQVGGKEEGGTTWQEGSRRRGWPLEWGKMTFGGRPGLVRQKIPVISKGFRVSEADTRVPCAHEGIHPSLLAP